MLESTTGAIETTALALASFDGLLTTAPTIADSVVTPRATTEDTPLVINGLTVADADNPASARATLTVTGGTVAVNAAGGGTITGNGTSSITVTGTVAQINARINGMSFTPALNQNTAIAGYTPRIDISVSDLTNTDGPTVLSITNLVVTPLNDAPTLGGGTGASVGEGGTLNFLAATTAGQGFIQAQLGLADVDNLAVQVIVKLAGLPAHGTLKLSGNSIAVGSTFSVADISNLSYTHDGTQVTSTTTDTFLVTIDDGAGGLLTNRSVNITITPVNQPPSVSGTVTVVEGETGVRLDNNGLLPTLAIPRGAIVTGDPEGAPISSYNITSLPGHGTLFYNGVAIVSASPGSPFVVTDITKLTYSHDGSNFAADSFNLSVTDDGGGTGISATTAGTINLAIYPNDDDPVLTTNVTQTLGAGPASRTITPAMLRVTDSDSPDSTLTYTLTSVPAPALGYFRLSGQTLVAGATFTQADISAGNLVYVTLSNTARTDSISFTVKDGGVRLFPDVRDGGIYNTLAQNSLLTVNTFSIVVTNAVTPDPGPAPGNGPVNTVPVDDGAKAVTLLESQTVTLTNAMLHATDPDNTPAQLVYRLVSLPASGSVTLNGAALVVNQSFTQADVNSGLVRFANAGNEKFFDTFTYSLSDGQAVTSLQTFSITVIPQNDTPSATTAGRLVAEGGSFAVSTANIVLSDADTVADSTAGSQYANNNVLRFRITGTVAHGTLTLNGVAVVAGIDGVGTEVTSAQLAAGNLVYTHDGSETFTDSFKLVPIDNQGITAAAATATNQVSTGAEVTVPIFITPVNDAPTKVDKFQLIAGEAGAIQEGATAVIGGATGYSIINGVAGSGTPTFNPASAHLVFSDADNSSVQRQYRVTSAPINGQLLLSGAGLGVGSIFTQADLDSGRISYKHSGTETSTDSFGYVVSDGDWTANDTTAFAQGGPAATPSTYLIEITPLNDLPTLVTPASIDAFAAGAGVTAITGVALTDADLAALRPGETDFVRAEVRVLDSGNAAVAAALLNYGAADPAGGSAFFAGKGSNFLIVQGTKAQVDAILASLTIAFSADADASTYKIRVTIDDRLYDSSGALTTGANGGPGPNLSRPR